MDDDINYLKHGANDIREVMTEYLDVLTDISTKYTFETRAYIVSIERKEKVTSKNDTKKKNEARK